MSEVPSLLGRDDFSFPTLFYIALCFTWFHIDGNATRLKESKNAAHPLFYWMKAAFPVFAEWWRRRDSNSRPPRCERDALPTELLPHRQKRRILYQRPIVQSRYFNGKIATRDKCVWKILKIAGWFVYKLTFYGILPSGFGKEN